jgi:hypothetical protein
MLEREFLTGNTVYAPQPCYPENEVYTLLRSPHIARNEEALVKPLADVGPLRQKYMSHLHYVLMVDSDTIIPPETLEYMLDPPADVVLGVCPRKNTRNGKTAMTRFVPLQYREDYYYSDLPSERTLIKGGGFACALVKSNVFTRMDYPWFQYTLTADGTTLSEDYYFCQNARMFGIDVYMEPRVKCGHLARYFQYE